MKRQIGLSCGLLLLTMAVPAAVTPPQWLAAGTEWHILVRQYSRGGGKVTPKDQTDAAQARIPNVQYEFDMIIRVLPPVMTGENPLARFEFVPGENAPEEIRGQAYVLEVSLNTGKAHDIHMTDGRFPGSSALETAGEEKVLLTDIFGFPVDWILSEPEDIVTTPPDRQTRLKAGSQATLTLSRHLQPGQERIVQFEAAVNYETTGPFRKVIQTWVPGEPWWRTFSRTRGLVLDLEAFRLE